MTALQAAFYFCAMTGVCALIGGLLAVLRHVWLHHVQGREGTTWARADVILLKPPTPEEEFFWPDWQWPPR